jgi:hypothetical protein
MFFFARVAVVLLALFVLVDPTIAQSRRALRDPRPPAAPEGSQIRDRLNAGTIGLAGGLLEGAPIRFAAEIARVVNEGGDMQVLPIVTRGPTENVNDLLYLTGVHTAIINSDALEEYKSQVPQIQQRIAYTPSLFPSELHIFVRPEIKTLADLAGKTFIPHPVALAKMRPGDQIAAVVFVTSKPVDAFVKGKWEEGFKLLPVEFGPKFEDYYISSYLDAADYPNLIAKDQRIATIAVPAILASYKWRPDSPRYRRVAQFVELLFGRIDKLRSAGFDPKWKDVNLRTQAPGLERVQAAQEWLDRSAPDKESARP